MQKHCIYCRSRHRCRRRRRGRCSRSHRISASSPLSVRSVCALTLTKFIGKIRIQMNYAIALYIYWSFDEKPLLLLFHSIQGEI